jgi:hypothetical protein
MAMLGLLTRRQISSNSMVKTGRSIQEGLKILVLEMMDPFGSLEPTEKAVDMVSTEWTKHSPNGIKFLDQLLELMLHQMVMPGLLTIRTKSSNMMVQNGRNNQELLKILVLEPTELFGSLEPTEKAVDMVSIEEPWFLKNPHGQEWVELVKKLMLMDLDFHGLLTHKAISSNTMERNG